MPKRKTYDWETIESEYRTGKLSNRQLAKTYGCSESTIRKKAKNEGWEKDLSRLVEEKVRTKLVRTKVRTENASEKQVVEEAAEHDVQVVESHIKSIGKSKDITNALLAELHAGTLSHDELVVLIEGMKKEESKRADFLMRSISLPERAKTLTQLVNALGRLIDLERQAYNIDGDRDGSGDDALKQIIVELQADTTKPGIAPPGED